MNTLTYTVIYTDDFGKADFVTTRDKTELLDVLADLEPRDVSILVDGAPAGAHTLARIEAEMIHRHNA